MESQMTLPTYVKTAITTLERAGKEAYVVGGCVRDALRGETPHDYDLTTSATPAEMQKIFAKFRTVETGIKHGTLTVLIEGHPLEITTYRIDGSYADGRHPDAVSFTAELTKDLARRDFTVNAMAYHPTRGLVDPFGGSADLAAKTVRAVGDAATRFAEDGLRILRALRFAATLAFEIEPATAAALHSSAPLLKKIAAERISVEFSKLLCGVWAGRYLHAFSDTVSVFLPQIAGYSRPQAATLAASRQVLPLRLALLFVQINAQSEVQALMRALRFDNGTARTVMTLCKYACEPMVQTPPAVKRALREMPPETLELLFDLQVALGTTAKETADGIRTILADVLATGACYNIGMLAIDGKTLKTLGVPPGKQMGALLENLLEQVITDGLPNTAEALIAYVKTQL